MKKKILVLSCVLSVIAAAGLNLSLFNNKSSLSDLAFANIEALGGIEVGPVCRYDTNEFCYMILDEFGADIIWGYPNNAS